MKHERYKLGRAQLRFHAFEKVVAPHVLMYERRGSVEASHQDCQIGRELVPFINGVPGRCIP
jgi:hypothetical protein